MTTITALPAAPTRGDPATFAATADTFLSALPTFGTQCNAVAAEMSRDAGIANSLAAAFMLPGYRGTSTSSVTFGTGTKVVTTQNNLLFIAGMAVTLSLTASATSYMQGTVTSYSGTTLTLNITSSNASGTYNDWQVTPTNTNLLVKGQDAQVASLNGGPIAGMRNRFINGSMAVDQRNIGASQTIAAGGSAQYTVDRWYAYCLGANVAGSQIKNSAGTGYYYQLSGAASNTKVAFGQRIESINIADLAGSTVTVSASLLNSLVTAVTWTAYYPSSIDNYTGKTLIASGTLSVNSIFSKQSFQVALPALAVNGVEIEFSVNNQTSGIFCIADVQLEAGTLATPIERRLLGHEQQLCYRYCQTWSTDGAGHLGVGYWTNITVFWMVLQLRTPMRQEAYTVTASLPSTTLRIVPPSGSPIAATGIGFGTSSSAALQVNISVASGGTVGVPAALVGSGVSRAYILASAEL